MKLAARLLIVATIWFLQACMHGQTPQVNVQPSHQAVQSISCERAIATQNRINHYFHNRVVPKIGDCWQGVKGQGTIAVEFNYKKGKSGWTAERMKVLGSTLTEGQDAVALQCLQDAVQGTSFPVQDGDLSAEEFLVNWSWPVPLPRDLNAVAQRMIDTGGGGRGCGGSEGPAPACHDCFYIPIVGISYCGSTCVGYKNCRRTESGCNMGPIEPRCATGSLYGNLGGIVMY